MIELLLPIFTAVVVVIGGALAYWNQKRLDRKHQLIALRREIYRDFVSGLVDAAEGNSERHLRSRIEALVIASDDVLVKLKAYNLQVEGGQGEVQTGSSSYKDCLAEVISAMRHDVFQSSKISTSEFADLLPVHRD